jgi:hypothetical protein
MTDDLLDRMFDAVDSAFARLGRAMKVGAGWTLTCQLCGFVTDDARLAQVHGMAEHAISWEGVHQASDPIRVDDERGRRFDYPLADGRIWMVARKRRKGP